MSTEDRRYPETDREHNEDERSNKSSLAMLGVAAGASVMQSGVPFTAPMGPALMALPAMLEEDGLGVVNNPRRREKNLKG